MGGKERRTGLLEADFVRFGTAASLELVVFLVLCKEEEEEVEDVQVSHLHRQLRGKIPYTSGGLGFLPEPEEGVNASGT